jgi:anti-sigma factor RsiW
MSELTCRDVVDFLMDYLAGGLDPEQRVAFDAHLAACPDCVVYLRDYEETVRLGKAAFEYLDAPAAEQLPPELVQAILAARRKPP